MCCKPAAICMEFMTGTSKMALRKPVSSSAVTELIGSKPSKGRKVRVILHSSSYDASWSVI